MKRISLFVGIIILLTMTGCLVEERGRPGYYRGYEHHHYEGHRPPAVIVEPPRPPEIIVR
jgi:hypothetical protein